MRTTFINIILLNLLIVIGCNSESKSTIKEVSTLPEAVSNNAGCEGFVDGTPYLYSFGGIDSTKIYSGIHLRSFRTNLESLKSERIPDLPDSLGKIAAGASRIGNIIYIIGGCCGTNPDHIREIVKVAEKYKPRKINLYA